MKTAILISQNSDEWIDLEKELSKSKELRLYVYSDVLELVEFLLNRFCDLVILDVDMFKEKTVQLVRLINRLHSNVRVILLSDQENMSYCSAALSYGVMSYQIKPITPYSLIHLISNSIQLKTKSKEDL
ncbi:MAG: hypothetical protein Kow0037_22520 [Calditrichia bacterium]